jgi:alkanesulfonate monooxygenase SsuD/methylene tetrahydromethanopterin reductase-like flavin-dependent oxidoreductase (luciferase family)
VNVGIGLPNAVPGAPAELQVEWAVRADEGPFSSVGVLDRFAYPCHEPLETLAAAARATNRIGLATTVVIGPLRANEDLARSSQFIHESSGGRLTLGLAIGARKDDYEVTGSPMANRGERLSGQLSYLRNKWGQTNGHRNDAPTLLVGGGSDAAFARVARFADGYVHGGGPPRAFIRARNSILSAWEDFGRPGRPRLWGQGYFALGDESVVARGHEYMLDYYAFTGPFAQRIAEGLLTTPQSVAQFVRGYAEAGCDELVLFPAVAEIDQVDRLSEVLGNGS